MKPGQRFQMQSWSQRDGERVWEPMENGAAAHVWRPRATAVDAVAKCLAWTGFIAIPAMQVVDLETGTVVWRDNTLHYPEAGERIDLPDAEDHVARTQARQRIDGARVPSERIADPPEPAQAETLF